MQQSDYNARERQLLEQFALSVFTDPKSTDTDRASARKRLEHVDRLINLRALDRMAEAEKDVLEYLLCKAAGVPHNRGLARSYRARLLAEAARTLANELQRQLDEVLASEQSAARPHGESADEPVA